MHANRPPPTRRVRLWQRADFPVRLGLMIGVIFLAAGPLALLADFVWSLHLARLWAQISGTLVGLVLVAMVIWSPRFRPWIRAILLGIAVLFIGAVIDSVDGKQDLIPSVVLLLTVWAGLFAIETYTLAQPSQHRSVLRWVGIVIGVLAIAIYLSTAGYYFVLNLVHGPLDYDRHLLYGLALIIMPILSYIRRRSESDNDTQRTSESDSHV